MDRWGRAYFALQAIAGVSWRAAIFVSPVVREATLGNLDPVTVAVVDIPLFVMASALAAFGFRSAAVVSTGWTGIVAVALALYAAITTEAGWGVLVIGAATAGSLIALCLTLLGRRGRIPFRSMAYYTLGLAAIHVDEPGAPSTGGSATW